MGYAAAYFVGMTFAAIISRVAKRPAPVFTIVIWGAGAIGFALFASR